MDFYFSETLRRVKSNSFWYTSLYRYYLLERSKYQFLLHLNDFQRGNIEFRSYFILGRTKWDHQKRHQRYVTQSVDIGLNRTIKNPEQCPSFSIAVFNRYFIRRDLLSKMSCRKACLNLTVKVKVTLHWFWVFLACDFSLKISLSP